jgi:hypothetical protein
VPIAPQYAAYIPVILRVAGTLAILGSSCNPNYSGYTIVIKRKICMENYDALFTPMTINKTTIKNRIVMCPMGGTELIQ